MPISETSTSSSFGTGSRDDVLVSLKNIHKTFGGVEALRGANLDINRGRVTALVGDNGAGKSTLIKILMGVHQPTTGTIHIEGNEAVIPDPETARSYGLEAIYQDLALVGTFDLASNFFLGRELTKSYLGGLIKVLDRDRMRSEAVKVLKERVGIHIGSPYASAFVMSGGQRQALAIGRAIHTDAQLVIMDEPTAALGVEETERVLQIIERLKEQGLTVFIVSHNLEHVFRCADTIAVMHSGRVTAHVEKKRVTHQEIIGYIMGTNIVS